MDDQQTTKATSKQSLQNCAVRSTLASNWFRSHFSLMPELRLCNRSLTFFLLIFLRHVTQVILLYRPLKCFVYQTPHRFTKPNNLERNGCRNTGNNTEYFSLLSICTSYYSMLFCFTKHKSVCLTNTSPCYSNKQFGPKWLQNTSNIIFCFIDCFRAFQRYICVG